MKVKFKYFVSYAWFSKKEQGYGNIEYVTTRKIDIDLIREIETDLNKNERIGKSIILNYKLLRKEPQP